MTGIARVRRTPIVRQMDDAPPETPDHADLIVQLSAGNRRRDVNLRTYNGQLEAKDVTLEAPVRMPNGAVVRRTLVVTIQRTLLRARPDVVGTWIVTRIRVAPDAARR